MPRLCEINGWKIRIYAQNVYTQLPLPPPSGRMCSMMRRPPRRLSVFDVRVDGSFFGSPFPPRLALYLLRNVYYANSTLQISLFAHTLL